MSAPVPGPRPGPPSGYAPGPRPGPGPGAGPGPAPQPGAPSADAAGTVAALDRSVQRLGELDDLPVGEHVARYDALHGELSEALAAIDGV